MRRTHKVAGSVRFPIGDSRYKDTKEGGMFVRLFVVPDEFEFYGVGICGAEDCYQFCGEVYVGSDTGRCVEYFFPGINQDWECWEDYRKYLSIKLLANIWLGDTGWSGYNKQEERYFTATYDDLTDDGKRIYDTIKHVYDGLGSLHIVTFLDT